MENFKVCMGKRMRQQRKLLHLTQEQLAEKLNISVKHYGGVERGDAGLSLENLVAVSDILGVNLDYLIRGNESAKEVIPDRIREFYLHCPPEKRQDLIIFLEAAEKLFLP